MRDEEKLRARKLPDETTANREVRLMQICTTFIYEWPKWAPLFEEKIAPGKKKQARAFDVDCQLHYAHDCFPLIWFHDWMEYFYVQKALAYLISLVVKLV